MEGMVLLLVPIGALIGLIVATVMLADVALFGGARRAREREEAKRRWRAPYIGGEDLFAWSRKTASEAADAALGDGRGGGAPLGVARALHEGATRAMLPEASERELERVLPCPPGGQGPIGVTAAEAIALAEHVRWSLPRKERERVLARARRLADQRRYAPTACASRGCALQGPDDVCLAYGLRPLQCRPLHADVILRCGAGPGGGPAEASAAEDARRVAEGFQAGWADALERVGLDGGIYELDAALATALSLDDACLRWLEGGRLFEGCRPVGAPGTQR